MKKLLVLALLLPLGACASIESTYNSVTNATVSPKVALVAVNSFDALEVVATGYRSLPPCTTTQLAACYNTTVWPSIKKAILTGRTARSAVEAALTATPSGIPIASYNNLNAAISILQSYYTQYGIQTVSK